jgi:hypothetical protein
MQQAYHRRCFQGFCKSSSIGSPEKKKKKSTSNNNFLPKKKNQVKLPNDCYRDHGIKRLEQCGTKKGIK